MLPPRATAALLAATLVPLAGALGAATPGRAPEPDRTAPAAGTAVADAFADRVAPVLAAHCASCHDADELAGELDLARFRGERDALREPEVWSDVARMLRRGKMPPEVAETRPDEAEVRAVLDWIEARVEVAAPDASAARAGRTTARRLNRYEFENAVLDLFGVAFDATGTLPADGVSHGFDVIGASLSMPPLLFEKVFDAAERVAAEAVPDDAQLREERRTADRMELEGGARARGADHVRMNSYGVATARFDVARTGDYLVRFSAAAEQAGPDPARVGVAIDGEVVAVVDVTAERQDGPAMHEVAVRLAAGPRRVSATFVNDYYRPEDPDPRNRDRNLVLYDLALSGPTDAPIATPFEARYVEDGDWDDGKRGARRVVERVARLAWRGPVTRNQVSALLQVAPRGAEPREVVRAALVAVLVSPRFLYRVEHDADEGTRALDGHETATRLAAFLWASVPDEALLDAAASGALDDADGVSRQVDRMLRDARSSRLAASFAAQWLQLRRLDAAAPDPARFPDWDDALADSMRRESEAFFEAVLRERRPIAELLDADFTFVDERLARHYGIAGVQGDALRRVAIPPHLAGVRGGLLGQGASLVATSMPTRTSPVVRGKWVLEALLATPPSPPPPGVDSIDEAVRDGRAKSVREQLELHRSKRACQVCHEPMDGLGFALENYGPTGAWRESEDGAPIDARAELPGGVRFEGPGGLRARLLEGDAFRRGLARHLATYALGRGLTDADRDAVDALSAALPADADLHALIHAIARDDLFLRHRRGDDE